ncbi:MAG TPA: hypothetical protein VG013_36060, partial [Gemmataceae bacterium]|nr:hypothetical protein [Gemmataceae bacterium]
MLYERSAGPFRHWGAWLVVVGLVAAAGCQGKGNIKGVVKIKDSGKPLPGGRITFLGESGKKAVRSSLIQDGNYSIEDFPAGPVKVVVESGAASSGGKKVAIDPKYGNAQESGLTYEVTKGDQ